MDTERKWGGDISVWLQQLLLLSQHDSDTLQKHEICFNVRLYLPYCNRECEIFLRLNSVGLQSFRFGPEIAYVASCVLDVLKGVRNKTLVGGAKKGKYNTFILEIIKISRVICMIDTPSEPKRQVVHARMFILLPLISIINFNLGLIIKLIGVALLPSFIGLGNFRHLFNRSDTKPKPVLTWFLSFSYARGSLLVFCCVSHWPLMTFYFILFVHCN